MRYLFLLALILIPSLAYAEEWQPYAFEDAGGVKVIYLKPGSDLQTELIKGGYKNVLALPVDATKLPDRADRNAWSLQNGEVVVDLVKKEAIEAEKLLNANKKQEVLDKLGITEGELEAVTIDLGK